MHIVLVDGSRTGLMILYRMLEHRGDAVVLFTEGREALDYLRDTPEADVLVTAIEVGEVSGLDLARQARAIADAGRPLYVLAMSATRGSAALASALGAGADAFMGKPPPAEELEAWLAVAERTVAEKRRLVFLATTDPLSGLLNRRAFAERAGEILGAAQGPVSLVLWDIDGFKSVNARHGHAAGDRVIAAAGGLRLPPDAVAGRLGGDEFAALLPGVPAEGAASVADHLRGQVAAVAAGADPITASFGVAEHGGGGLDALLAAADRALRAAKEAGRDRVALASP